MFKKGGYRRAYSESTCSEFYTAYDGSSEEEDYGGGGGGMRMPTRGGGNSEGSPSKRARLSADRRSRRGE